MNGNRIRHAASGSACSLLSDGIAVNFAATVEDTDNFNALVADTIERQILANDQMPDASSYIVSSHSGERVLCKLLPPPFDRIKHAVCGVWIVRRDVRPDGNQVFVGSIRADNREHDQPPRREAS